MKYISKKVIYGKTYYYLQYKNYTKNLGEALPTNLQKQFIDFFLGIGKKEYEALPAQIKQNFRYGGLEKLEELHAIHIILNHDLFKKANIAFYDEFIRLFTYHSNRAEGSKTTKKEIDDFAASKIRTPRTITEREIFNSFMAFDHAISDEMRWNMKHVKEIHNLLLNKLDPLIAGQWKKENNIVSNQPTADYKEVPEKMKILMGWVNEEFKKNVYPPELALKFYVRFEAIHPFHDGNGRIGRILLNAILHKYDYPPVIFFSENHKTHCAAIQYALSGRWSKMNKYFLEQVKKTINNIFKKIFPDAT